MYDLLFLAEEVGSPGMFVLIQTWIEVSYNQATVSVLVYGFLSEVFIVERGCRQGDGLSAYIFLLCAKVLGLMIRNNQNIKGILIDNTEYKLSQYADDTVLFRDGSENSMNSAFHTLNMICLKVEIEKTQAVWIGSKNIVTIKLFCNSS